MDKWRGITLLQLIRCAKRGNLDTWDEDLPVLAGALRATRNRQTGFTPNMMMLGREITLPVDVVLGTAEANLQKQSPASYVNQLRKILGEAHAKARDQLCASQAMQKRDYDLKLHPRSYEAGDLVYELNSAMKVGQCCKLQSPWRGPLLVTEVLSPVLFRVQDRRKERVVHHDRLKLCRDREVPVWMRRLRHTFLSNLSSRPSDPAQEDQLVVPEGVIPDTRTTSRAEAALDGLAQLFEAEVQACSESSAPGTTSSNPQPPKAAMTTRRGRVVNRPSHLRDYTA